LLLGVYPGVKAQNTYDGEIKYRNIETYRQDDKLFASLTVDLSSIDLHKQIMIELTPVIKDTIRQNEYRFAPIVIVGKTRDKVYQREVVLGNSDMKKEPFRYILRKNGTMQSEPLTLSFPHEKWMSTAKLVFEEKISGCANCELGQREHLITDHVVRAPFTPVYELQYVVPEAEPVKHRSETYAAHLNFVVGKYELLRDFENNATILNEVDNIVREIRGDQNLTIQDLTIVGYASPEGNYDSNMELSKNRTYSFVNYLSRSHNLRESEMKTDWKGEDWEGLRKVVSESSLSDRDAILRVIDENYDVAKRKNALKALNGGNTYQNLLRNYYPPLRRIEYTFSYVAKAFNIEEAKEIVKTKPQHLSLNEMFLVANTYEKGSVEFNRIFDVAVRLFPTDPVANLNAAVQEIEMGALDRAITRLKTIQDSPEALNNLGVAYAKKQEYDQAKACFERAVEKGNAVAGTNMEQLENSLLD